MALSYAHTIQQSFSRQASTVHDKMSQALFTSLGIKEETLTDLVLNSIGEECSPHVYTRKFTNKQENSMSGADWLWCIGSPGAWITFAVQAKIQSPSTRRINYLHYRNGEQYNLLINFCRAFHLMPKYSIFSLVDDNELLPSVAPLTVDDRSQWAFASVAPKYVKRLNRAADRHISQIRPYSIPWSCMFQEGDSSAESVAGVVVRNLSRSYWPIEDAYGRANGEPTASRGMRTPWENPHPEKTVTTDMPKLVLYLLTLERTPSANPVSQVSLVSDTPARDVIETELRKVVTSRSWKLFGRTLEHSLSRIKESGTQYVAFPRYETLPSVEYIRSEDRPDDVKGYVTFRST